MCTTGTNGKKIEETTGINIQKFQSGPLGGDQQIGALVANDELDIIIFFRDPLTAQPHEPDVSALMRLCDVYLIPLATNIAAAEIVIHGLERGDFTWRNVLKERKKGMQLNEKNWNNMLSYYWWVRNYSNR